MNLKKNIDLSTSESFGEEWAKFTQEDLNLLEAKRRFEEYFHIFPWNDLPEKAEGIDIGCGASRSDEFVSFLPLPLISRLLPKKINHFYFYRDSLDIIQKFI